MTDPTSRHLLIIGAFRENEVEESHPLNHVLREIEAVNGTIQRIMLKPLNLMQVNEMLADTLHSDLEDAMPLAQIVFEKTLGNPFFIKQFLSTLYQENLIWYELPSQGGTTSVNPLELSAAEGPGRWQWDHMAISKMRMTYLLKNKGQDLRGFYIATPDYKLILAISTIQTSKV